MDSTSWLQDWYFKQCDGDWEHGYGIKIETLDNPGWYVSIDLRETRYAQVSDVDLLNLNLGDSDFINCKIKAGVFQGAGDTMKLNDILQVFRKWIESY